MEARVGVTRFEVRFRRDRGEAEGGHARLRNEIGCGWWLHEMRCEFEVV